jgi:hypothetical protein
MAAPDEKTALEAVKKIQSMSGADIEKAVRAQLGDPLLAMFALLAQNVSPGDDERETAKKVQLMIIAYLVHDELNRKK